MCGCMLIPNAKTEDRSFKPQQAKCRFENASLKNTDDEQPGRYDARNQSGIYGAPRSLPDRRLRCHLHRGSSARRLQYWATAVQ